MKYVKKIEEYFVGLLILLVSVGLFINIISREIFKYNFDGTEEFIRYSMIYITFIGMAICFRKGLHVGVDLLMTSLKTDRKRYLQLLINILALVFMIFLVKYGVDLVMFSYNSGQISPSLEIKTYMIYLAIPVGALLSILHISINTIMLLKNKSIDFQEE